MFILRAAFWLGLVVFLIPSESGKGPGPAAGALQAVTAVRGAIADLAGMCDRQPEVCSQGGAALATLGQHAQVGAAALAAVLNSQLNGSGGSAAAIKAVKDGSTGTLAPQDVLPAWRAPGTGSKA